MKLKSGLHDCLYLCKIRELELNENFEDLLRSGGVLPSECLPVILMLNYFYSVLLEFQIAYGIEAGFFFFIIL